MDAVDGATPDDPTLGNAHEADVSTREDDAVDVGVALDSHSTGHDDPVNGEADGMLMLRR